MGAKKSKLSNAETKELLSQTYCTRPSRLRLRVRLGERPVTAVTRKELEQWHKDFIRDCPSGKLKKDEFQAIYSQFFPQGDPSKFAGFVFNVFDDNHVRILLLPSLPHPRGCRTASSPSTSSSWPSP